MAADHTAARCQAAPPRLAQWRRHFHFGAQDGNDSPLLTHPGGQLLPLRGARHRQDDPAKARKTAAHFDPECGIHPRHGRISPTRWAILALCQSLALTAFIRSFRAASCFGRLSRPGKPQARSSRAIPAVRTAKSGGRRESIQSARDSQVRFEIAQPIFARVDAQRPGLRPKRGKTLEGYFVAQAVQRVSFITLIQLA